MSKLTMKIDGMSCGHCVAAVKEALAEVEGVQASEVRIGQAEVSYDPAAVTPERLAEAVRDAGYEPAVA